MRSCPTMFHWIYVPFLLEMIFDSAYAFFLHFGMQKKVQHQSVFQTAAIFHGLKTMDINQLLHSTAVPHVHLIIPLHTSLSQLILLVLTFVLLLFFFVLKSLAS